MLQVVGEVDRGHPALPQLAVEVVAAGVRRAEALEGLRRPGHRAARTRGHHGARAATPLTSSAAAARASSPAAPEAAGRPAAERANSSPGPTGPTRGDARSSATGTPRRS